MPFMMSFLEGGALIGKPWPEMLLTLVWLSHANCLEYLFLIHKEAKRKQSSPFPMASYFNIYTFNWKAVTLRHKAKLWKAVSGIPDLLQTTSATRKAEKLSPFYKYQFSAYKSQQLHNFGRHQLQNNISVQLQLGNRHNQCWVLTRQGDVDVDVT